MAIHGKTAADCKAALEQARETLAGARRVLIGAGAGLSTAAGLEYGGERFQREFAPFIGRYGMTDMYSAGFYPFPSEEDRWAYWAHHAWVNDLGCGPMPLYSDLAHWVQGRDCFVLTTNADQQFQKAGFDPDRIFATQGDYGHLQCARPCHQGIYEADEAFAAIEADTGHGARIRVGDSALVPRCPQCGGPMAMHLRVDDSFVETEGWHRACERCRRFVEGIAEQPTVLLELGVGWNTPVWIRFPFERLARETGSPLIRLNYEDSRVPDAPAAMGLQGDIAELWPQLALSAGSGVGEDARIGEPAGEAADAPGAGGDSGAEHSGAGGDGGAVAPGAGVPCGGSAIGENPGIANGAPGAGRAADGRG